MKRKMNYLGFLGFLGFMGFNYFSTQESGYIFYFSFFAYFGYFIIGKLANEMPDERYVANSTKARSKVMMILSLTLFAIGAGTAFLPIFSREIVLIACVVGWIISIWSYALLFYYYEKH